MNNNNTFMFSFYTRPRPRRRRGGGGGIFGTFSLGCIINIIVLLHEFTFKTCNAETTSSAPETTVVTKEPTNKKIMIPSQEEIDIHEAAQELWESYAFGNYNYVYQRFGELLPEATLPMKVEVRNNFVSNVTYVADGTEVPKDWANNIPTMDGLFDMLGDIAEDGVFSWYVEYDDGMGYIVDIDIDLSEEMEDEEIRIKIIDLEGFVSPPSTTVAATTVVTADEDNYPFDEPNYDNPPLSPEVGIYLKSNRTLWDSLNITDYEFTYQKMCFCIIDATKEMRVIVRNGNEIINATYIQDDSSVDEEYLTIIKTVNDLFDMIQNYVDEDDVNNLVVSYDVEMGYPTMISIDGHEMIADDEYEYYAKDLVSAIPTVTMQGSEGTAESTTAAAHTTFTSTSVATPTSKPEETTATVKTTEIEDGNLPMEDKMASGGAGDDSEVFTNRDATTTMSSATSSATTASDGLYYLGMHSSVFAVAQGLTIAMIMMMVMANIV